MQQFFTYLLFLFVTTVAVTAWGSPPPPVAGPLPSSPLSDGQFFSSSSSSAAAPSPFHNLSEALAASEKFIEAVIASEGLPSLSVSFSVKGKKIFEKAYGYADLENDVYAEPDTKYRMASISKTFTSVLLGTLVDQGKLKYDDLLEKHLSASVYPPKSFPAGHRVNITIGQLLDHTAGTHVTALTDFDRIIPAINCTTMLAQFAQEALHFAPGSNFNYSNYGFQLLGAVIESVTGKSYQQAMGNFFSELGLHSTYVETIPLMLHKRARYYRPAGAIGTPGYKQNLPTLVFDEGFHIAGWWPSGALMSTSPDLVKYGNRIVDAVKRRSGSILSQQTLKEMWTKRTQNFPAFPWHPINEYGYGWFIGHVPASVNPNLKYRDFVWHSGGLMGVSTFLIIYPELEIVGAAMTNKGSALNLDNLLINMAENVYQFC